MAEYTLITSRMPKSTLGQLRELWEKGQLEKIWKPGAPEGTKRHLYIPFIGDMLPSPRRVKAFAKQIGADTGDLDDGHTYYSKEIISTKLARDGHEQFPDYRKVPILLRDGKVVATDSFDCILKLAKLTQKGRSLLPSGGELQAFRDLQGAANTFHDDVMFPILRSTYRLEPLTDDLIARFKETAGKLDALAKGLIENKNFLDPEQEDLRRYLFFNVLEYQDRLLKDPGLAEKLGWNDYPNLLKIYQELPKLPEAYFWDSIAPDTKPIATNRLTRKFNAQNGKGSLDPAPESRVVLLTGAAGGVAGTFIETLEDTPGGNYTIIGTDLPEKEGEFRSRFPDATFIPCDITNPEDVAFLYKTIETEHGCLDGLFHIAGVRGSQIPESALGTLTPDQERSVEFVQKVNKDGARLIIEGARGLLSKSAENNSHGRPFLFAMGSMGELAPMVDHPYAKSKVALTEMIANEAKESPEVYCFSIAPSLINGEFIGAGDDKDNLSNTEDNPALKVMRLLASEELVDVALKMIEHADGLEAGTPKFFDEINGQRHFMTGYRNKALRFYARNFSGEYKPAFQVPGDEDITNAPAIFQSPEVYWNPYRGSEDFPVTEKMRPELFPK